MKEKLMNYERASAMQCFVTGLGIGVALTLLFAPRSGASTRELIGQTMKDGEGWVKDKSASAKEYVATKAAGLRDRAQDAAETIARS
jgi:gas vesicle protein